MIVSNDFPTQTIFFCENQRIFINLHYVCDGNNDCGDSQDEKFCNHTLHHSVFFCLKGNQTISFKHVCDHFEDCNDGSDEKFCSNFLYCKQTHKKRFHFLFYSAFKNCNEENKAYFFIINF